MKRIEYRSRTDRVPGGELRIVEAAGMVYGRDHADGVTSHTFRHTIASWFAQADKAQKGAVLLGDTLETFVAFYGHLQPSDIDEAVNSL